MTCRWTGGDLLASCEPDSAIVGSRACYRVACEGVSLLRPVFEPPTIPEPSVEDTWISFTPRRDLCCLVVPLTPEVDASFAFIFSQRGKIGPLSLILARAAKETLDEKRLSELKSAMGVSRLLVDQEWMSEDAFYGRCTAERTVPPTA